MSTHSLSCAILEASPRPVRSFIIQNEVKWLQSFPLTRSDTSSIVQLLIFVLKACSVLATFKAQRLVCGIMAKLSLRTHGVYEPKLLVLSKGRAYAFSSEVESNLPPSFDSAVGGRGGVGSFCKR